MAEFPRWLRPVITFLAVCSLLIDPSTTRRTVQDLRQIVAFFNGACDEHICEHVCVSVKGGYICDCHPGYELHANGFTCREDRQKTTTPKDILPQSSGGKPSQHSTQLDSVTGAEPMQRDDIYLKAGILGNLIKTSESDSDHNKHDKSVLSNKESLDKHLNSGATGFESSQYIENAEAQNTKKTTWTSGEFKIESYDLRDGLPEPIKVSHRTGDNSKMQVENTNKVDLEGVHPKSGGLPVRLPGSRSCEGYQCRSGGYCSVDETDKPQCDCPLGWTGQRCEKEVTVIYPRFRGRGYLAFPVLRGAYQEFTISIQFKPKAVDGLLLFTAEDANAEGDFFSIALVNGSVHFSFECGTGPAVLKSRGNVTLGEWNTIWVQRVDHSGWLELNSEEPVQGRAMGGYRRITLRENLFLGGYRDIGAVAGRVGTDQAFIGCIQEMTINTYKYDMRRGDIVGDALFGLNVEECSMDVCGSVQCQNGGTCAAQSADRHICLCPLGTVGSLCEEKIEVHIPAFGGHSYLQYPGLQRTTLSYTEIEVIFKPTDPDGLIIYNGYTTDRKGDYLSLAMREGNVEFSFDLGTGPALLRSRDPVSLDMWHVVRVYRTGMEGELYVDDQPRVEALSQGAYTQLTLLLPLYIGGHHTFDHTSKHANLSKSFSGCIQKILINEKPLKLMEEAEDGLNVANCDHPCVGQPCMNGGACVPSHDLYSCNCPLGYTNTNCEDIMGEAIRVPMFRGMSFLKFSNPNILQRVMGKNIDIQMELRPSGANGLIFWSGQEQMTSRNDYLALGFEDGSLQFRFNLGSGEVVIEHNSSKLFDGKIHTIRAQREEQDAYLSLDGTEIYEGTSPGRYKYLNTNNLLYIGGMPEVAHNTLRKFTTGFVGCITKLTLATDYEVNLVGQAEDGQNVEQCS